MQPVKHALRAGGYNQGGFHRLPDCFAPSPPRRQAFEGDGTGGERCIVWKGPMPPRSGTAPRASNSSALRYIASVSSEKSHGLKITKNPQLAWTGFQGKVFEETHTYVETIYV